MISGLVIAPTSFFVSEAPRCLLDYFIDSEQTKYDELH